MSNEEAKRGIQRGMVVEFDFTFLPGAAILRDVATKRLATEGIVLTDRLEARYLAGSSYLAGMRALAAACEKSAMNVSEVISDIQVAFAETLAATLTAKGIADEEKAFVKAVADANVKVVIATRMPEGAVRAMFPELDENALVVYSETSTAYGFCKWDGWRRAVRKYDLYERLSVAVVGSGFSSKAALVAGMGIIAKPAPETIYQDFSGSNAMCETLTSALLPEVKNILRM